jgi:proline dehydrogenase
MEKVALKLLEFENINYNQVNNHNNSALKYACENNMEKVALKLLEFENIDYNKVNN